MGYSLLGAIVGFVMGWALHWYWTRGAEQFGAGGREPYAAEAESTWEETPLVDPSVVREISSAEEEEAVEVGAPADKAPESDGGPPAEAAVVDAEAAGDSGVSEDAAAEELVAYCPRCRTRRTILSPDYVVTDRGRHAVRGTCAECGGKMFSFVKRPE